MAKRTSLSKRAELTKLERESAALKRRIHSLHMEMRGVPPAQKVILPLPGMPKVSDHALIRYLERVHSLDLDRVRKKMLTPDVRQAMDGGEVYATIEGSIAVLRGKLFVTVLTNEMVE